MTDFEYAEYTMPEKLKSKIAYLQKVAGLNDADKQRYQDFWNISDGDIDAAWLRKLEMHVYPQRPPGVIFDMQPWEAFTSPATGKVITSKVERREDMRVSGCRDWEGLEVEKKYSHIARQEEEKKEDAKLEEAVGEAWRHLDHSKKEVLLSGD